MAEAINDCSASIDETLDSQVHHQNNDVNIPSQQCFEHSFYLLPISISQCINIITKMKVTRVDIDIIPIQLKKITGYVVEPLTHIIEKLFALGVFPDQIKSARVTLYSRKENYLTHQIMGRSRPWVLCQFFFKLS